MCLNMLDVDGHTVKPDLSGHSKEDQKIYMFSRLIIAECRSKVLCTECSNGAFSSTFDLH